ncbi:sensor histidine kinase [Mucilaginibacter sp. E4BP6]|uniref:sensor histidine kinase n=1 Tax=Mucilaginibacter sp. E4BP6 TaxID=2723089 RepID=UPI0015C9BAA5|nr:histidine kinase [Mucilaginibacter sp. E4BP6]NYE64766.1 sensor histidine kinase YesM [Mucilaginibacter sp. E4BP6]
MKNNKAVYHLAFWLLAYIFWIFIFRNSTLVLTHSITIQFCYLIFIAGNYYYNSFFTVPYLLNKKRYLLFGIFFFTGILLGALLRVPVSFLISKYLFRVNTAAFNPYSVFFDSFINILFWVVIILALKLIIEKRNSQRYIEKIEREKAENELNFLKAQFNPHFLFNSINSIYAHINKSNKTARDMLLVFSEMLRYQLYECNVERIELDREINYIRNYISLQKSRIDERITVSFCVDGSNGNIQIAPLILITFIENAFKYVGFNEAKKNVIEIKLQCENGFLRFSIYNTKDLFVNPAEKSSGLGIANVKRRLELLYPDKHLLAIKETETDYSITLECLTF